MAGPLREGVGGWKGQAIKEKKLFFVTFFSKVPKFHRPLSSRGGLNHGGSNSIKENNRSVSSQKHIEKKYIYIYICIYIEFQLPYSDVIIKTHWSKCFYSNHTILKECSARLWDWSLCHGACSCCITAMLYDFLLVIFRSLY